MYIHFARFVSGFDVRLIGLRNDPTKGGLKEIEQVYGPEQLDELVRAADILVLCVPQTPETEGMITRRRLELLGPEGLVVHMARGSACRLLKGSYALLLGNDAQDALINGLGGARLELGIGQEPFLSGVADEGQFG